MEDIRKYMDIHSVQVEVEPTTALAVPDSRSQTSEAMFMQRNSLMHCAAEGKERHGNKHDNQPAVKLCAGIGTSGSPFATRNTP